MNYRHIYHAGNICDVVKHSVLALLVSYLKEKDKGFAVLDTHAGCGSYDLRDPLALKTGEAESGIQKLWRAYNAAPEVPDVLSPYLSVLKELNPSSGQLGIYPGSPLLCAKLLRQQDRLMACELHPEDAQSLRRAMKHETNVSIHHRDGYEAIKALTPFQEKRGLILIDPPFEQPEEFQNLCAALRQIKSTFPQAMIALWYPIKERPLIWKFHEDILSIGYDKCLVAEFIYQPEVRHDRLNGSGFVFVNPPWVLENQINSLYPLLHKALETPAQETVVRPLREA